MSCDVGLLFPPSLLPDGNLSVDFANATHSLLPTRSED